MHYRRSGSEELYMVIRDVFCASAVTCFLWAMHRVASSMKTETRLHALEQVGDVYTAEERERLLEKIKSRSLQL